MSDRNEIISRLSNIADHAVHNQSDSVKEKCEKYGLKFYEQFAKPVAVAAVKLIVADEIDEWSKTEGSVHLAQQIPIHNIRESMTYYQGFSRGSALIPCRAIKRNDDGSVHMRFGESCPWEQTVRYDPQFCYWDEMPSEEEKKSVCW